MTEIMHSDDRKLIIIQPFLTNAGFLSRLINLVLVICCVADVAITLWVIFSVSTVELRPYSTEYYKRVPCRTVLLRGLHLDTVQHIGVVYSAVKCSAVEW